MDDIIELVRVRHAKAVAKVERAKKALDSARSELADIEAALRVLGGISSNGDSDSAKSGPSDAVAERQQNIIKLLPDSAPGVEPKELHSRYEFHFAEDISLDTFRTTIWRMKKDERRFAFEGDEWTVENAEGRYWRERVRDLDDGEFDHWGPPDDLDDDIEF